MEDQTTAPIQPISRSPLTFKGVFGIAWMLYKRSFKGLVLLCFLLLAVPILLVILPFFTTLFNFVQSDMNGVAQPFDDIGRFLALFGFVWLMMLVMLFVLLPMLMGSMHMEMDQCVEGRPGRFRDLWRYALPIGLKRFYTTFLALVVVQLAVSFVLSFVPRITTGTFGMSPLVSFSFNQSGIVNMEVIPPGLSLLFSAISLVISAIFAACYMLVYPAAVHEGRRAFKAVGRAFQLAIKRFGRVFLVNIVLMLIWNVAGMIISLPFIGPLQTLQAGEGEAFFLSFVPILVGVMMLIMILYIPFNVALSTALYIDSAARVPPKGVPQYPAYSRYGQPADAPAVQQPPPQLPDTSPHTQPTDALPEEPPAGEAESDPTEGL